MSNSIKMTGSLHSLEDAQTFGSGFTKREFVLKVEDGKFDQLIKFELLQDKVGEIDGYKVGDNLTVNFNIRGREHNGRVFNNLVAWRLENLQGQSNVRDVEKPTYVNKQDDDDDEIPF